MHYTRVQDIDNFGKQWNTQVDNIFFDDAKCTAQQFLVHVQQHNLQAYHRMRFNVVCTEVKYK